MAYISTEEVKRIRNKLKTQFPDVKFSVKGGGSQTVRISILSSTRKDFRGYVVKPKLDPETNRYSWKKVENVYGKQDSPRELNIGKEKLKKGVDDDETKLAGYIETRHIPFFNKLIEIAQSEGWYDAVPYGRDASYYIDVSIGSVDKPYVYKGKARYSKQKVKGAKLMGKDKSGKPFYYRSGIKIYGNLDVDEELKKAQSEGRIKKDKDNKSYYIRNGIKVYVPEPKVSELSKVRLF